MGIRLNVSGGMGERLYDKRRKVRTPSAVPVPLHTIIIHLFLSIFPPPFYLRYTKDILRSQILINQCIESHQILSMRLHRCDPLSSSELSGRIGRSVSILLKSASFRPSLMRRSQVIILVLVLRVPFFQQLQSSHGVL